LASFAAITGMNDIEHPLHILSISVLGRLTQHAQIWISYLSLLAQDYSAALAAGIKVNQTEMLEKLEKSGYNHAMLLMYYSTMGIV
jgi:hypothetical protein